MVKIYKNKNERFETTEGTELSSGYPIALYLGSNQFVKGRIEHNGRDYYFLCPNGKHIKLEDGDMIEVL